MADRIRNVFISHVHEDDDGLGKLKELLASHDYTIRDSSITSARPNNAQNPEYIKSEILAPAIRWAGVFIVYVTPSTKSSDWVNWEIEYAQTHDMRIVGVWASGDSGVDAPAALDEYADAVVGWTAERIIGAIEGRINDWSGPTGQPQPERAIRRYSC